MSPTEKLIENIIDIVHARRYDRNCNNLARLLEATLKTHYAIGRWVSVEERLPEASQYFYIKINGEPEGGCWFDPSIREFDQREPKVSHWLDLDMPSGKEEA